MVHRVADGRTELWGPHGDRRDGVVALVVSQRVARRLPLIIKKFIAKKLDSQIKRFYYLQVNILVTMEENGL